MHAEARPPEGGRARRDRDAGEFGLAVGHLQLPQVMTLACRSVRGGFYHPTADHLEHPQPPASRPLTSAPQRRDSAASGLPRKLRLKIGPNPTNTSASWPAQ